MMVKKIGEVPAPPTPAPAVGVRKSGEPAFGEILRREIRQAELKFSAHAERRLAERQISLGPHDLEKINQAASLAEAKGSRRSLLIYGDLALVTSIANRTVVTAVNGEAAANNVFTNIDSAVIVK
ncbi:Flagellar protein [Candidatus Desulforudis audaxviator]|nr:Flagellar protein [Candidatus Desulforudis audaxviator]